MIMAWSAACVFHTWTRFPALLADVRGTKSFLNLKMFFLGFLVTLGELSFGGDLDGGVFFPAMMCSSIRFTEDR